jgi:hypothetical protein
VGEGKFKSRLHHAPKLASMLCVITAENEVKRLHREEADQLVWAGRAFYAPKRVWKQWRVAQGVMEKDAVILKELAK